MLFLGFFDDLASALTSVYAVVLYVLILLGLILFIILAPQKDTAPPPQSPELAKKGSRFYSLTRLDNQSDQLVRGDYCDNLSLKQICDGFRDFAAGNLKLYYDEIDIRRFIASLAVSKIIILQGISGTGKTSLAYAFGEFLDNPATVIPVQPMWKERTDLIGYYNEFTKRFNETMLLQKIYEANYSKDIYVTVLDEMNIARIEYYFAEFLSLLELPNPQRRYLDVVSDRWDNDPRQLKNGQVKLAENMWFIGTANNDDSTFSISDKVYDRAMILNLDTKAAPRTVAPQNPLPISFSRFLELARAAQSEFGVTRRNQRRLDELDRLLIKDFNISFGNRIKKQILQYVPIYIACGGGELEALDDILAKKLMRKLEMLNPIYLRNSADGLIAKLDELFGVDCLKQCKAFISRLAKNT